MKKVGILLTNVAIAVGIIMGRVDYEAARKRREMAAPDYNPLASSRIKPPAARKSSRRDSEADSDSRGTPQSGDTRSESPARSPEKDTEPEPQSLEPSRFKERLEKLSSAIAKLELKSALEGAKALAAETVHGPLSVHDKALVLAAKARVFDRVLSLQPKGDPQPATRAVRSALEVRLSNGNMLTALDVREEADRYVFRLQAGALFTPLKEDVLEVRKVEKEVSTGPAWADLERKLSKLDDPIALYVDGVERCCRLGLQSEAIQVLERAITRTDSEKIPLLFIPDADEAFLLDWQIAAGHRPPHESGEIAAVTSAESSSAAPQDIPAVPSRKKPEIFDPESALQKAPLDDASKAVLGQATRLFGEAQALYQGALGKEGREADLESAKNRIHKALDLVETLPPDSEVSKIRRQLAQLLSDVARASPF